MDRYALQLPNIDMHKDPDGTWCIFADVEKRIEETEHELRRVIEELEYKMRRIQEEVASMQGEWF